MFHYADRPQVFQRLADLLIGQYYEYAGPFEKDIQEVLHSLHGGDSVDVKVRRDCLAKMLRESGSNLAPWQKGLVIHALGDAYAHTAPDGTQHGGILGHFWESEKGHEPDSPVSKPENFGAYIVALNTALGGRGTTSQLQSVLTELTAPAAPDLKYGVIIVGTRKPTSDDRMDRARNLAIKLGYKGSYFPESGDTLDSNQRMLDQSDVTNLMNMIKQRCPCIK